MGLGDWKEVRCLTRASDSSAGAKARVEPVAGSDSAVAWFNLGASSDAIRFPPFQREKAAGWQLFSFSTL
jgi:hypothetical protein